MRQEGPVGFDFTGNREAAIQLAPLARALMGQQSHYMSFNKLPSDVRDHKLLDGTVIRLIQLPGGIRKIQIFVVDKEDQERLRLWGIVSKPISDEFTDGWGEPWYPENIHDDVNMGAEGGTRPYRVYQKGKRITSETYVPKLEKNPDKYLEDNDNIPSWKNEGNNGIRIGKGVYESGKHCLSWECASRYYSVNIDSFDGVIYSNGYTLCQTSFSGTNDRLLGVGINEEYNQLVVIIAQKKTSPTSVQYKIKCRNWEPNGYENDGNYNPVTNVNGWRTLETFTGAVGIISTYPHSCAVFNEDGNQASVVAGLQFLITFDIDFSTWDGTIVEEDWAVTKTVTGSRRFLRTYNDRVETDEYLSYEDDPTTETDDLCPWTLALAEDTRYTTHTQTWFVSNISDEASAEQPIAVEYDRNDRQILSLYKRTAINYKYDGSRKNIRKLQDLLESSGYDPINECIYGIWSGAGNVSYPWNEDNISNSYDHGYTDMWLNWNGTKLIDVEFGISRIIKEKTAKRTSTEFGGVNIWDETDRTISGPYRENFKLRGADLQTNTDFLHVHYDDWTESINDIYWTSTETSNYQSSWTKSHVETIDYIGYSYDTVFETEPGYSNVIGGGNELEPVPAWLGWEDSDDNVDSTFPWSTTVTSAITTLMTDFEQEIMFRKGEWLVASELTFPSTSYIYVYSKADLDTIDPAYTTNVRQRIEGAI